MRRVNDDKLMLVLESREKRDASVSYHSNRSVADLQVIESLTRQAA